MFCTQCGIQMPDGAKFCAACGAARQGHAAPVARAKSNAALKLAAAGGLVAILAAAGYAMYSPGPGEKEVAAAKDTKPAAVPAPAPVATTQPATPEPQAPEPAAPASEPPPSASAPDPAEIAAAHQALDQKIADEEAAAKQAGRKK